MSERIKKIIVFMGLLLPVLIISTPVNAYADTGLVGKNLVVADLASWAMSVVCDIIQLLLNGICDILNFIITVIFGADINSIIKQEPQTLGGIELNLFAFNFETYNPYGLIASIVYSFLRVYAFAFLPANFTISIVKSIINGGSPRAFEEVKSSFYDMIIKMLLLVLAPYIVDILLSLRTSFMSTAYSQIQNLGGSFEEAMETIISGDETGYIDIDDSLDASVTWQTINSVMDSNDETLLGILLSFFIRISYYGFTIYLMVIYVVLSLTTALWFIALPMVCIRGKNFKANLSKWFETGIGIYVTPLIDLICLTIPSLLNTIISETSSTGTGTNVITSGVAEVVVIAISLWCLIPLRSKLREFAGIAETGADQIGMGTMKQASVLAFGAARLMGNKNNANAEADEADRKADEASEFANENERYESAQNARAAEEVEAQVGDGTGTEGSDANGITDKGSESKSSSSGGKIPGTGSGDIKNDDIRADVPKTGDAGADTDSDVLSDTSVETSDVSNETSDVSGGTDSKSSDSKYSDLKNTDRELAKRDAELAEKARDTKNDYNRRINEAQENASKEDSFAEDAETAGDIQGAEEHRANANGYRQEAETLEGQKQAELDSIEGGRSSIAQERQSTSSAGLAERDAELAQREQEVKSSYDEQIREEEQAAADEDEKADTYEAAGNMQDAKECRDNAEQHRSNARELNSKEQQELTDIENERKDIERRRNAIREQSTGAELDERDAEVAEQMDKTGAEYDAKIAGEEKAASAETQMAVDEASKGNEPEAQKHRDSAAQHTANAENLRQAKEDALAPMQQERDDIAAQKQANAGTTSRGGYSGQSDTSGGDHPQTISEAREMLNQADAESKRTADTFRAMDDQLASRDAELNQQMQGIKTEYGGKQAEEARLSAEAKRQAAEIKATNQGADVSGLNAEAARHDEARATLQKQEKEALAPLETERSSIKAQREALKAGISEQNARQKEIAAKQKDLAAKQKSVANATGAAYSEDALEAEHQANMANIKQRYMSLDDFDKNGNLDNLSYGQQAELYRQRANQIRANENSRKRKAAVGAVVGGAGMAMYGPTLSVGAGIAGASMGSGIANKKGNAMMNQTLEQREHEMQGMAGNMQMASSDVTSRSRSVDDIKSAIDNSSMSGAEKRQAKRTVNAMEDTYGAGVRMEMSDEHRDTRVPLRRRENVVPFARTMAGPGANLSAPPVNVSSISSEAGSAYDRIGQELNGRKAGRYATAPADSSNVMGKLRSIYERRPQPEVPVPDIDVPKPQRNVATDYLYAKFNNPSKDNKGNDIKSANDLLLSVGRLSSSDDVALGDFEHRCSVCGCESLTSGALGKNNPGSSKTWQGVAMHDLNTAISSLCTNPETSKILIDASDILMGESRESAYQFFDVGAGKEAGDILWSKVEKSSSGYASGLTKEGVLRYLASFFGTAQEQ